MQPGYRSNRRRFTPTANVCRGVLEQHKRDTDPTNRSAYNHLQYALQEQIFRCPSVIEGHSGMVDSDTNPNEFYRDHRQFVHIEYMDRITF